MAEPAAAKVRNQVHQNAIMVETIHKEERTQKLFTSFSTNPRSVACIAGKPNTAELIATAVDDDVLASIKQSTAGPRAKYPTPLTSAQEYGWDIEAEDEKPNPVYHRPKKSSDVTQYMAAAWKQKEQQKLGGQK